MRDIYVLSTMINSHRSGHIHMRNNQSLAIEMFRASRNISPSWMVFLNKSTTLGIAWDEFLKESLTGIIGKIRITEKINFYFLFCFFF